MPLSCVWTIAGSDSSGGAGIQNDLKTFQSLGVHGCSVLTTITAQNNQYIQDVETISPNRVAAQLAVLKDAFPPQSIKLGLIGDATNLPIIQDYLAEYTGQVICDPVLRASSGKNFPIEKTALVDLLKYVDVLTPNVHEAEILLNRSLTTHNEIEQAALDLLALGTKSVYIKGGHIASDHWSQDYWTNGEMAFWLANERLATRNYRGTGCALSSAIATCLALGYALPDALVIAKMYVNRGIRLANVLADDTAFIFHGTWPEDEKDLPFVSEYPTAHSLAPFPPCNAKELGLYPIVDRADWLAKLLPTGVKTLQLRIKDLQGAALEQEIKAGIALAKQHQANLFINDYWELAIQYGAYGVHLGQEDLQTAHLEKIRAAGLRLGVSTYGYYEIARAHAINPSYIACGPIFPTTSKILSCTPQGLAQLHRWRKMLHYPLVAIGGIDLEKMPAVLATQVDGVAMISAITQAPDPVAATQRLLKMM